MAAEHSSLRRLEPVPELAPQPVRWFCGSCARPGEPGETRVCEACGMGLLLFASKDFAPAPGDAFVVCDDHLEVQAVSAAAEWLLARGEQELVNTPIAGTLVAAEADREDRSSLLRALAAAVSAPGARPQELALRVAGEYGVRFYARVGACGPGHGALLTLKQIR